MAENEIHWDFSKCCTFIAISCESVELLCTLFGALSLCVCLLNNGYVTRSELVVMEAVFDDFTSRVYMIIFRMICAGAAAQVFSEIDHGRLGLQLVNFQIFQQMHWYASSWHSMN